MIRRVYHFTNIKQFAEELKAARSHFATEIERAQREAKAEHENQLRHLHNKYQKSMQATTAQAAPSPASRRGRFVQNENSHAPPDSDARLVTLRNQYKDSLATLQKDHEAQLATLQKDHEAQFAALTKDHDIKQHALRDENASIVSQLQKEHETATSAKLAAQKESAETKLREVEQKLNEAHTKEKQELLQKITEAEQKRKVTEQDLEAAVRVTEEWKAKIDTVSKELAARKPKEQANTEHESQEPLDLQQSVAQGDLMQDSIQDSMMDPRSAFKIPTVPRALGTKPPPSRSVHRRKRTRDQTPNSMIFEDNADEPESSAFLPDSFGQPRQQPIQSSSERQILADVMNRRGNGTPAKLATKEPEDDSRSLSSAMSSSDLAEMARVAAETAAEDREQPRANSSQRLSSSARAKSRTPLPASASKLSNGAKPKSNMVSTRNSSTTTLRINAEHAQANHVARNPSYTLTHPDHVGRTASSVSHLRVGPKQAQAPPSESSDFPTLHDQKNTYSRKQPSSLHPLRSKTGEGSDMLVRDSQEENRKRPSSPVRGHDTHKRTRLDVSAPRPPPVKPNAFQQHMEIQRAKSRDGLDSGPTRNPSSSAGHGPVAATPKPALSVRARRSNAVGLKAKTTGVPQAKRAKSARAERKLSRSSRMLAVRLTS